MLDLEHEAELERQVELADLSQLKHLLVAKTQVTPHGLRVWVLRPPGEGRPLLSKHNIRAREPIRVTKEVREEFDVSQKAVVYQVTDFEVSVVLKNGDKLILGQLVEIQRVDDDQMYWRMRDILKELGTFTGTPRKLRDALFAGRSLESVESLPTPLTTDGGGLRLFNKGLNTLQRGAVEFSLRQRRLAVIHGPPGTGKTTTVVEAILQHLKLGYRVLACAHSNTAVDNLLERLAKEDVRHGLDLAMVRLGHPARIREHLLDFWLDRVVENCAHGDANRHRAKPMTSSRVTKQQEKLVIQKSKVVLCTLANTSEFGPLGPADGSALGAFDLVVIDECSQSVEAACWLAAQRSGKLFLAGDHRQLPPTILSQPAARRGLAVSMMERQVKLHGEAAVRMLCTQYRMHELIQQWPSEKMYGGRLEAAPAVRGHRLSQLDGVRDTADTAPVLLLIDTAGCRLTEAAPDETGSRSNDGEADLVTAHVAALVRDGVRQSQIGVIAPYKAQTARVRAGLRQRRVEDVEVHSVDGFQGREKEVILVTLVRSKKKCSLEFVADLRRINVAVTRARRQLVLVCDTKTMCRDEGMRSLIQHIRRHGEIRSARKYANQLGAEALARFRPGPYG